VCLGLFRRSVGLFQRSSNPFSPQSPPRRRISSEAEEIVEKKITTGRISSFILVTHTCLLDDWDHDETTAFRFFHGSRNCYRQCPSFVSDYYDTEL